MAKWITRSRSVKTRVKSRGCVYVCGGGWHSGGGSRGRRMGFGIAERVGAVGENGSEWENGCSLPSVGLSGAARRVSSQCVVSLRVVVMLFCSPLLLPLLFLCFRPSERGGPFSGNLQFVAGTVSTVSCCCHTFPSVFRVT